MWGEARGEKEGRGGESKESASRRGEARQGEATTLGAEEASSPSKSRITNVGKFEVRNYLYRVITKSVITSTW